MTRATTIDAGIELISTMTSSEFAEAVKMLYSSAEIACSDLGITTKEMTLLVMKKRNPPERVARKLRDRLTMRG